MKRTNIFVELLQYLNVKYTTEYAMNLYKGNPYYNSLYGLSMMLSSYNIENAAIQLKNKEQIIDLEFPVIAYASNHFVLIKQIKNEKVQCLFNNENTIISLKEFISIWSGIVLIFEVNENSKEPNYHENKTRELLNNLFLNLLLFIPFLGGILYLVFWGVRNGINVVILCLLMLGLYVCFLLIQKQLKIKSAYADKLCSIFQKNNCNNVLESEAAIFLGIFTWSEIGFGYFLSTFLICTIFPKWLFYCACICILTLPFTIWSVWYQRFRVKQWCPMCLIIIVIFWTQFTVYLYLGTFQLGEFKSIELFWIIIIYISISLIVHQLVSILTIAFSQQELSHELNRIKLNENVFQTLLKSSNHYDISYSTSHIILGNPNAKTLISILTNPHCEPCAKMHFRLTNLLRKTGDKFCLQLIFSSFDESLNISNKMLISAYVNYGAQAAIKIYDDWFEGGKYKKDAFFIKNKLFLDNVIEKEFLIHETFIKQNKLRITPTILINGYELPAHYQVEDLELLDINQINLS